MTPSELNMIQVHEYIWRSPRPDLWRIALETDIRTVLSLETGWYERLHPRKMSEEAAANQFGLRDLNVSLSWLFPPQPAQLRVCLDVLLDAQLDRRPVLVHCRSGVDRTGLVIAAFRVTVQHWSINDAIAEMVDLGFHVFRYAHWLDAAPQLLSEV